MQSFLQYVSAETKSDSPDPLSRSAKLICFKTKLLAHFSCLNTCHCAFFAVADAPQRARKNGQK